MQYLFRIAGMRERGHHTRRTVQQADHFLYCCIAKSDKPLLAVAIVVVSLLLTIFILCIA